MSETQRELQKLLVSFRENCYVGLINFSFILLHHYPWQVSGAISYLPPHLFLAGSSPVCSYSRLHLLAACQSLLQTSSNPACSTDLLQLHSNEQMKSCSFPILEFPASAAPRQPGSFEHSSCTPLRLKEMQLLYQTSNPVSTSFLCLFLACHAAFMALCNLWFLQAWFTFTFCFLSAWCPEFSLQQVFCCAPEIPKPSSGAASPISTSYHCSLHSCACWNSTKTTWDVQVKAQCSFIFPFYAV